MLNILAKTYHKPLIVNGVQYESAQVAYEALKGFTGALDIKMNVIQAEPAKAVREAHSKPETRKIAIHKVEVKQYMTKKAEPGFDFMKKWNNDNPMPMRVMYGEVLEETKGMYRMKLHGRAERNASHCSHCLRGLTHPVSVYYGIGPICGEHMHMAPMKVLEKIADKEELFKQADAKLRETTWEGWIIKSAITSMYVVEEIKEAKAV